MSAPKLSSINVPITPLLGLFSCRYQLSAHSPPRRVHPRREEEQQQNKDEVHFGDGFGVPLGFGPAPHRPAAARLHQAQHSSFLSHVLAKAAPSGVRVRAAGLLSIIWEQKELHVLKKTKLHRSISYNAMRRFPVCIHNHKQCR